MNKIYVTGHRNPDTDSVVSAMAYAALRNATGDREYVAARLGHLSDETNLILNRFGFEPPLFIKNKYMLGDEFSMLDVAVAPLLWRLDHYGIELSKTAAPLMKYAERIFSRPAYIEALTPSEKVMRR